MESIGDMFTRYMHTNTQTHKKHMTIIGIDVGGIGILCNIWIRGDSSIRQGQHLHDKNPERIHSH